MWRYGDRGPAFVAMAVFGAAIVVTAILLIRLIDPHSDAAVTKQRIQPTRAQRHAASELSAFVYARGSYREGGNVKSCRPNWHPQRHTAAQLHCTSFGQAVTYTRLQTGLQASAYFRTLASNGHAGAGSWGGCTSRLPGGRWSRTVFGRKQSGEVAFRQSGGHAFVVWSWPATRTVALATADAGSRPQLCKVWARGG